MPRQRENPVLPTLIPMEGNGVLRDAGKRIPCILRGLPRCRVILAPALSLQQPAKVWWFLPRWDQAHNTKPALPRRGGRAWDQGSGMERRSGDAGGDADQVAGGNEFGFEGGGEGAGWLVEQKPPPEQSGASRRQISRSARIRNDLDLPPASTAG